MAFQDRLNMNTRATVPQTPYTTERYEKEIALSSKASAEAADVNIKHRVDDVRLGRRKCESRWFENDVAENEPPCLCFTSTGESSIKIVHQGAWTGSWAFESSLDKKSWSAYALNTVINLSDGDKVYFRGQKDGTPQGDGIYHKFVMTGSIAASGDVTYLLNRLGSVSDLTPYGAYTFRCLFLGCSSLTSVPSLQSITLTEGCYSLMFQNCTSLTSVPPDLLPATTLAASCYNEMFNGCTSLTQAPKLPATTLTPYCYGGMFTSCTSLLTAPLLPATTLAEECYNWMFGWCSSLKGPIYISAESPIFESWTACEGMFVDSATFTGVGGVIKVGGNASLWNQGNCGIDSEHWTVELIQ